MIYKYKVDIKWNQIISILFIWFRIKLIINQITKFILIKLLGKWIQRRGIMFFSNSIPSFHSYFTFLSKLVTFVETGQNLNLFFIPIFPSPVKTVLWVMALLNQFYDSLAISNLIDTLFISFNFFHFIGRYCSWEFTSNL